MRFSLRRVDLLSASAEIHRFNASSTMRSRWSALGPRSAVRRPPAESRSGRHRVRRDEHGQQIERPASRTCRSRASMTCPYPTYSIVRHQGWGSPSSERLLFDAAGDPLALIELTGGLSTSHCAAVRRCGCDSVADASDVHTSDRWRQRGWPPGTPSRFRGSSGCANRTYQGPAWLTGGRTRVVRRRSGRSASPGS